MSTELIVRRDLGLARSAEEVDAIFKSAYASGFTLQELGDIYGVTRERIRQRIANPVELSLMREYPPHERVTRKKSMRRNAVASKKRILGLPCSAAALAVPVETLTELARLHGLATKVRGWTPLESPERQAVKPFGDLLFKTVTDFKVPQQQLEKLVGLKGQTLSVWLKNHGYMKQSPSQKSYRGVVFGGGTKAGPRLVLGGECKRGHPLTESNLGFQKAGRYCIACSREAAKRRYQQSKLTNQKESTS